MPVLYLIFCYFARGCVLLLNAEEGSRPRTTLGIYEVLRSETEQNLGEGRAEPRTVYPLLNDPSGA